jgi:hypothetical protein
MAKSAFTLDELRIWNSIYGPSRGPTPGRLKIMVEEFASRGLVPVMMRLGDDMLPYDPVAFRDALVEAFANKDDDQVQAYYHPLECEKVVGSTATTWTQWARLILSVEGLVPHDCDDRHPVIVENAPRLRLPTTVRDELFERGLSTSSVCRLVSARMAAFFIAAQYEAWATPAQVAQVAPFKETLRKQGFVVRDVIVRKDEGLDAVLDGLDPVVSNPSPPKVLCGLDPIPPAVRQPFNAPIAGQAADVIFGSSPGDVIVSSLREVQDEEFCRVYGRHADYFLGVTPDAVVSAPVVADCEEEPDEQEDEIVDDIDAEIARTYATLRQLQARKEQVQREAKRKSYLAATVSDVTISADDRVTELVIRLPDGTLQTFTRKSSDVDDLLDDIV